MTQPIVVENFAANTGQFSVIGIGTHGPDTFSISGGQGNYTDFAGSIDTTISQHTGGMPILANQFFVYAQLGIPTLPAPVVGPFVNADVGIFKNASDNISFEFGTAVTGTGYSFDILVLVSGTQHQLGGAVTPTLPVAIGMSVDDNSVTGWVYDGTTWTIATTVDVGAFIDLTAAGALTGYYAGCGIISNTPGSISVNKLWSGPPDQLYFCDLYWGNTVLLLPLDGANGQTTTTDISPLANTMTFSGSGSSLQQSGPKFGSASLLSGALNFFGSYCVQTGVYTAGSALDIFTSTEWTIEGQIFLAFASANPFTFFAYGDSGSASTSSIFQIFIDTITSTTANFKMADYSNWGTGITVSVNTACSHGWHHLAVVGHSGVITMYLDGVAILTGSGLWLPAAYVHAGPTTVCIGSMSRYSGATSGGYIDEVRVTAGVARYTSNFTPPALPFSTFACGQTVPNVSGLPLLAAQTAIFALGLVVGATTVTCSNTIPQGSVISTSPAIGSNVPDGSTIDFVVSSGPCTLTFELQTKFVPVTIGKAIMTANPGQINPRIYPPYEDSTVRIVPPRILT